MVKVKENKNIKEVEFQKKTLIANVNVESDVEKVIMDYENRIIHRESKIAERYPNLKEDVIRMIEIVDANDHGLLKALKDGIIEAQAEYYYNDSMQFEALRRFVLNN